MVKKIIFFCAAALGGLYITGHDPADIKREILDLSGQNARAFAGNERETDWGD